MRAYFVGVLLLFVNRLLLLTYYVVFKLYVDSSIRRTMLFIAPINRSITIASSELPSTALRSAPSSRLLMKVSSISAPVPADVFAISVETGEILWTYNAKLEPEVILSGAPGRIDRGTGLSA